MSDIDRGRAQRLLEAENLDGMVLFQPEAFRYATGASAGVATMWGRAGSAIALVPADAGQRLAAIVSDHAAGGMAHLAGAMDIRTHRIWIDAVALADAQSTDDINAAYRQAGSGGYRPETFDQDGCFRLLGDILKERGLVNASLGIDLAFMPAADFENLRRLIPSVTWRDASGVLRKLRAVKNSREIGRLRKAALCAEAGLEALAATVRPGIRIPDLSATWLAGARGEAQRGGHGLSGHWDYISVGADLQNSLAEISPGALIKADVGTLVDGYSSDGARTFVFGQPSLLAADIYKALHNAFLCGLEKLKPGNAFGEVHAVMLASMRKDGFTDYFRGHFGHSVGGSVGIEEWPFISYGNAEVIEPDMVLALETPFYGQGLGALMIEDQFLVTDQGVECMNRLPRELALLT